jgi:outer membrane protein TolC
MTTIMRRQLFWMLFLFLPVLVKAQIADAGLKFLVTSAYEKNDSIKINNFRIQQAKIDEQTTKFNYLPRISSNLTYTRLNDDLVFPGDLQTLLLGTQSLLIKSKAGVPFNAPLPASVKLQPIPPISEKSILKSSANMQWLLFSGFKVENGMKAYQHQQKALSYLSDKQKTNIIIEISDLYDKLALLNAGDSVINRSQTVLNEQKRFVEGAIKNGLATPLDRKKIEFALEKLNLKKVENDSQRLTLIYRLHQLTGIDVDNLSVLQPHLQPILLLNDSSTVERVEIKSLNEAIEASRYKEKAEKSDYIPKLAAFGQYEFLKKDLTLLDPRWYVGLRLQWNLFDGLTARNNAKKAVLDRKIYETQKQAAEDLIDFGKARAKQQLQTAHQKISMVNAQLSLSAETFDFVSKQYKNGLTNMTELLNALNDLEKSRFDLQQAYYEQRRAAIQLSDVNGTLFNNF